jgi:putative oxidoreductase
MKELISRIHILLNPLRSIANQFFSPLLDLTLRLYVAEDFLRSGIGRAKDYINGSWDTQLFLFEFEHPVPGLSPQLSAPITTVAEIILPLLLIIGLFTRLGAAGIFIMALVIQLTYQENFQHLVWMSMMAVIFIKGPGAISLDHFLVKWIEKDIETKEMQKV